MLGAALLLLDGADRLIERSALERQYILVIAPRGFLIAEDAHARKRLGGAYHPERTRETEAVGKPAT
jgi:hypothetical protein